MALISSEDDTGALGAPCRITGHRQHLGNNHSGRKSLSESDTHTHTYTHTHTHTHTHTLKDTQANTHSFVPVFYWYQSPKHHCFILTRQVSISVVERLYLILIRPIGGGIHIVHISGYGKLVSHSFTHPASYRATSSFIWIYYCIIIHVTFVNFNIIII